LALLLVVAACCCLLLLLLLLLFVLRRQGKYQTQDAGGMRRRIEVQERSREPAKDVGTMVQEGTGG